MTKVRRSHAEAREEMRRGIIRAGRAQLADRGAAGLSVREIARELGVASSAIYRHVSTRDELLTLLVVDAYDDLAGSVLSDPAADPADPAEAFPAVARAMRSWAVEHPERWSLIYGTPVPGYVAPAQRTTGPGTRVMARFVEILGHDRMPEEEPNSLSPAYREELAEGIHDLGVRAPAAAAADAVEVWLSLIGVINAEIFGYLGADLSRHGEEILERWVRRTARRLGLDEADDAQA
jgi:AcrR family transcriptional regulator